MLCLPTQVMARYDRSCSSTSYQWLCPFALPQSPRPVSALLIQHEIVGRPRCWQPAGAAAPRKNTHYQQAAHILDPRTTSLGGGSRASWRGPHERADAAAYAHKSLLCLVTVGLTLCWIGGVLRLLLPETLQRRQVRRRLSPITIYVVLAYNPLPVGSWLVSTAMFRAAQPTPDSAPRSHLSFPNAHVHHDPQQQVRRQSSLVEAATMASCAWSNAARAVAPVRVLADVELVVVRVLDGQQIFVQPD